ncbi:transposable element Tcb2 transposase [Trichonephila clavipes]|nr:transposable element Tcb2 transposase [Trichonephila clavipes]
MLEIQTQMLHHNSQKFTVKQGCPTRGPPVACQYRPRRERIVWQALVDPTVTRSTIRADVGVTIVPQTIFRHLAEANLKSKRPFRVLPLTPETFPKWSPRGNFPARVAQDFLRHFQTLPWPARSPDLSPVEHVWDQLKRQIPSCHSVHDLEVAVQDLGAHLPQDNISCQVIYSQFGLAIHQNDHQARRRFVEWTQNETAVVPDFHKRILFSDEAHFWLNGYVHKQNCRIWSEANPQVYVETPLHPEKLTLWCALWAGGILQKR